MKRIKLYAIIGSVFAMTCFLSISFASCNNETEITNEPEHFSRDLNELSEKFCQLMDSKSFTTRGEGNSSLSIKTQEFDMQFQQFLSQHDLTVDLTPTERKSLTLAENDWMTLIADEDAFLTYISENKTPQFQKIFDKIISGNISTITINSIIQDKGLKLNEKLLLTIQLDIALNTPINLQSVNQTVSICDKRYARAVHSCQIQFATAIAGAVATSIASGGLGLFTGGVAVVNYFNCIDNANDSYEDCIKDHAK